ncbi:NAD(P)-binding protein [Lacrimispora algidixylanolytica]|uniref:Uncharacterized protein n=1 Tax=Lacrimispora algidixylanolytica TaxID=94868 RepID=A0A419SYL9_9FIRM|nr:NAD(P)-binding protein [Lacrimispora algidixylanolytica]RKD30357.1 hypothetical protein BET01_07130 [Lacrimispora algidixylanolytica]
MVNDKLFISSAFSAGLLLFCAALRKVVVIGGGLTGVVLGYSLTKDKGKQVDILEMFPEIAMVILKLLWVVKK